MIAVFSTNDWVRKAWVGAHLEVHIGACQRCHEAWQTMPTAKLQNALSLQGRGNVCGRVQDALVQAILAEQKEAEVRGTLPELESACTSPTATNDNTGSC